MARLCGKCNTCHALDKPCAKKLTLKQFQRRHRVAMVKTFKALEMAKKAKPSNKPYKIAG